MSRTNERNGFLFKIAELFLDDPAVGGRFDVQEERKQNKCRQVSEGGEAV